MTAAQYIERLYQQFQANDFELSAECLEDLQTSAAAWTEAAIEADPAGFIGEQFEVMADYHGFPLVVIFKTFAEWLTGN